MDVGRDNGMVVDRAYAAKAPYAFTGTVKKVIFDLKPAARHEDEQALHEAAAHGATAHGISAYRPAPGDDIRSSRYDSDQAANLSARRGRASRGSGCQDESVDRPGKVPLTARLLLRDSLTARRAAGIIATSRW